MSKSQISALGGVAVAILTILVSRGILGGQTATEAQTVLTALIAFGATVGIRSARP